MEIVIIASGIILILTCLGIIGMLWDWFYIDAKSVPGLITVSLVPAALAALMAWALMSL